MKTTAKMFWSGRSQTVRLPEEFQFDGKEVQVRREGQAVILEPIEDEWAWLDRITGPFDQEFLDALDDDPGEQPGRPIFE